MVTSCKTLICLQVCCRHIRVQQICGNKCNIHLQCNFTTIWSLQLPENCCYQFAGDSKQYFDTDCSCGESIPTRDSDLRVKLCLWMYTRLLCMGGLKWAWYTLFVDAQILEISLKSANLHKACRLLPCDRSLPLTTLCIDDDEGVMKRLSSSLVGLVYTLLHFS